MTNLVQKLLGKEKKPLIEKTLSADEIEPFFKTLGIDMDTIGFPSIKYKNAIPMERYWIDFKDVKVIPVKVDYVVKIIVKGEYMMQPMVSRKDSRGNWYPGGISRYSFKIEDEELSLKKMKTKWEK